MPPRVGTRAPLAAADALLLSSSSTTTTTTQQACRFSTTPCRAKTSAARRKMFQWINNGYGETIANSTMPVNMHGTPGVVFPNNPLYRSEPVVNDPTRRLIYERATKDGQALKAIAAEMGLDVRRVAAIVRLKEAQNQATKSVCIFLPFLPTFCTYLHPRACMMILLFKIFRLVLKTSKWLHFYD